MPKSHLLTESVWTIGPDGLQTHRPKGQRRRFTEQPVVTYLAYSTARVSRIKVTLICPGYSISTCIFLAISEAI